MTQPVPTATGGSQPVSVRPVRGHDGTSVIISLDATVEYDRIRDDLVRVLGQTPERWRHGTARVDLGDRNLELFDVRRLVHLLRDEFSLSVTALYTSERALHRYVARELKLQVFVRDPSEDWTHQELARIGEEDDPTRPAGLVDVVVLDDIGEEEVDLDSAGDDDPTRVTEMSRSKVGEDDDTVMATDPSAADDAPVIAEDPDDDDDAPVSLPVEPPPVSFAGGRRALTVSRTLRGGQKISFPGDVIVFGDVNPGSTVEAGGHILVLGSLRGLAHAGMHGDPASVIVAFELRPTQLRIGGHITFPSDDAGRGSRGFRPEVACVQGEVIIIEEYAGRLPVVLPPPSSHDATSPAPSASTEGDATHTE